MSACWHELAARLERSASARSGVAAGGMRYQLLQCLSIGATSPHAQVHALTRWDEASAQLIF
eukprot:5640165-Amphidinium_carterae.2